jgi:methionyl-tRNA formyltransferase
MQRPLCHRADDTGYTLHNAATDLIARMLPDLWEMIERDAFDPRPQDSFGSYYPRDSQRINQINWRYSAASIRNVVRALAPPMPGAYSYLDGTRCILARVGLRRRGVPNMPRGRSFSWTTRSSWPPARTTWPSNPWWWTGPKWTGPPFTNATSNT